MTAMINKANTNGHSLQNKKGIEDHLMAAKLFEAAAKNHRDAAKFHEEGNADEAFKRTIIALGNQRIGAECQNALSFLY